MTNHPKSARVAAVSTLCRRGTMIVAALVMITLLTVVVATVVLGGGRDADLTRLRLQSDRARLASSAAAQMAVKEFMDNIDRDSDGAIGTISDDSNSATDPLIGTTRIWATKAVSGSTTTVTARAQADGAAWATEVVLYSSSTGTPVAGNIMLVVVNSASLTAQETARKTLMEGWGYTVTPISATASSGTFTTALRTTSVVYVCETITDTVLNTKVKAATCGVINEENGLIDDFGCSSASTAFTDTAIDVINTTHYITSTFASGSLTIASANVRLMYASGTAGTYTKLCERLSSSNGSLMIMERGDSLYGGGSAAGRRVYLPWRGSGGSFDVNDLNANGQTIMRRAIEWCLLPVGYWALDSSSGTTAIDSIAARNGTLYSGPSWTTGKVNNGLSFDGSNDYVQIADHTQFKPTAALSICGWVKATSWGSGTDVSIILRKGDANPNNWELSIADGRVELLLDDNDDSGFQGNTVLSTNVWHHVAATWDGSNVRIYLDGVLDNTPAAKSGAIGTDTRSVYLGGRSGSTDVVNGIVDEVRFYSRCLTAAEVAALASPSGQPSITSWTAVDP